MTYRAAVWALSLASVAGIAAAQPMAREAYRAHLDRVNAQYEAERARCKPLEGHDRDFCRARALGERHVARAELDARYKPGPKSEERLALARADAAHALAKERCDALRGLQREVCRKDAKAALATDRANAKSVKAATADPQLQALGRERCESMGGSARDLCLADLQRRYGRL